MYPRLLPVGDAAIAVEFGDRIDVSVCDAVLTLDRELRRAGPPVVDTVPSYRSLLVIYDPAIADYATMVCHVEALISAPCPEPHPARVWRIPVVYGGQYGFDLDELAERNNMTAAEVVEQHRQALYLVYMIGFMPGFAYLGGLSPRLATPRRPTPRPSIPEGSVTIGGAQTALTSVEAPSGWHVIGRSPVKAFMPQREPACLLSAGDFVTFRAISPDEWQPLSIAAKRGDPVATIVQ